MPLYYLPIVSKFLSRVLVIIFILSFERVVGLPVLFLGLVLAWSDSFLFWQKICWLMVSAVILATTFLTPVSFALAGIFSCYGLYQHAKKRSPSRSISMLFIIISFCVVLAFVTKITISQRVLIYSSLSLIILLSILRSSLFFADEKIGTYLDRASLL